MHAGTAYAGQSPTNKNYHSLNVQKTTLHPDLGVSYGYLLYHRSKTILYKTTQIPKFIGPTWGPPGSCCPQMGPCWTQENCYQGSHIILGLNLPSGVAHRCAPLVIIIVDISGIIVLIDNNWKQLAAHPVNEDSSWWCKRPYGLYVIVVCADVDFLTEASFGLQVLSLPASVCLCVRPCVQ